MPLLLVVGAAASSLLAFSYVVLGALHDRLSSRRALRRERARRALVALIADPDRDADWRQLPALARLPRRELADLLSPLASDLDGDALARLRAVADAAGLDPVIGRLGRSRRRAARLQAAQLMHLLPTGNPIVTALLGDPEALVRARAADGLAASEARIHAAELGQLLADPSPGVAFAAQQALLRAGNAAIAAVEAALARTDGQGVELALELAVNLPDSQLAAAVYALATSPNAPVRAQVARAAAAIDAQQARSLIAGLLDDPDPQVRAAAAASAGDAGMAGLATLIGKLLADGSWDVRYRAADALAQLGPPGLVVLRRALALDDRYARDVARQMIDIVEGRERSGWRRAFAPGAPAAA